MRTGMMWFDNSKRSLNAKILEAAQYYQKKYGKIPDTVIVHPAALVGEEYDPQHVKPMKEILPGHLWIGCEEAQHG